MLQSQIRIPRKLGGHRGVGAVARRMVSVSRTTEEQSPNPVLGQWCNGLSAHECLFKGAAVPTKTMAHIGVGVWGFGEVNGDCLACVVALMRTANGSWSMAKAYSLASIGQ